MMIRPAKDLGEQIRLARKAAGLAQRDLADNCRCGVRFISDLENGKPTIEFEKALLVANVLNMDLAIEKRRQ